MANPFRFYKVVGTSSERIYPQAGTRLRFASKAADSLYLPGLAVGVLQPGDTVFVQYNSSCVFVGYVAERIVRHGKGDIEGEDVTCLGPWGKMEMVPYRQYWKCTNGTEKLSSRVILNQYKSGAAQTLNAELKELALYGASRCGYLYDENNISVSGQQLPFDECRDITIADAIRRELRFFPRSVVYFDYDIIPTDEYAKPYINIKRVDTSGADADYIANLSRSSRRKRYTATPVTSVYLEIETTGSDGYRDITHQYASLQGGASAGEPGCLYATIQLAAPSSATVTQSFKSVTENIPNSLSDKTWWMSKHPRLKGLAASAVTITDGARSDASESTKYSRIAQATAGELEAAGLKCRVVEFTCKATITTTDDTESDVLLSMKFLTTNATTKTYTWVVSSSATAGDTCPSGLAQAILNDRAGSLLSEKVVLALRLDGTTALPTIGDLCDGLILQSYEIDCTTLVADLDFGAPEYLSPEDMASLLSGFRNRRKSTASVSRATGKTADADAQAETGSIPPLSASDWAPGKKSKTTIYGGSGHGNIVLDASSLASGSNIGVHTVTIPGAGTNNTDLTVKVLSSADFTAAGSSGGDYVAGSDTNIVFTPNQSTGKTAIDVYYL